MSCENFKIFPGDEVGPKKCSSLAMESANVAMVFRVGSENYWEPDKHDVWFFFIDGFLSTCLLAIC